MAAQSIPTAFFVGPWDLHRDLACVPDDPAAGSVVLVESVAKGQALPYHRQKLVLVLSALHHFARELEAEGYDVEVVHTPTYGEGIRRHVEARGAERVVALQPREWGLQRSLEAAAESGELGAELDLRPDGGEGGHFLLRREEFEAWAEEQGSSFRMDSFYRFMRQREGWLMDGDEPEGGRWSFDQENRQPPPDESPPDLPRYEPDDLTREIMARVREWPGHWGEVDGFDWPVTREQALAELDHFLELRGEGFGPYQDAMVHGERFLWHSRLSPALNLGLVLPREVVERTVGAYREGRLPLASAEGFVRQIIGWREFLRGLYWRRMPELREANHLQASRLLPAFYWQPERTDMRCLEDSARAVLETGYAHHIQRLMVLGNFALLAGVEPIQLSHWFWAAFVDAYEWVELPNVHGMALYADPSFTTKPYAASGAYIDRMSNYCGDCRYRVKERTGENACPFNSLFWRFIARHRDLVAKNPRMSALLGTWRRWSEEQRQEILEQAEGFLDGLEPAEHGWSFEDDAG
ncbi:MAG: cryptochrome/photolyase family protein [Acidobacteriota bacterium]|nr:cryptochrome/photolyase family protein [Acidobacteriota bacterium]